jgi:uncharacterized protein (DUF849 family)
MKKFLIMLPAMLCAAAGGAQDIPPASNDVVWAMQPDTPNMNDYEQFEKVLFKLLNEHADAELREQIVQQVQQRLKNKCFHKALRKYEDDKIKLEYEEIDPKVWEQVHAELSKPPEWQPQWLTQIPFRTQTYYYRIVEAKHPYDQEDAYALAQEKMYEEAPKSAVNLVCRYAKERDKKGYYHVYLLYQVAVSPDISPKYRDFNCYTNKEEQ